VWGEPGPSDKSDGNKGKRSVRGLSPSVDGLTDSSETVPNVVWGEPGPSDKSDGNKGKRSVRGLSPSVDGLTDSIRQGFGFTIFYFVENSVNFVYATNIFQSGNGSDFQFEITMKTFYRLLPLFFLFLRSGLIYPQTLQSVMSMQGATSVNDVATDAAGNSYITGFYHGQLIMNGVSVLTGTGMADVFIGKISNSGGLVWLTSAGGTNMDVGRSISTDPAGNVYVTGSFTDTAYFGTTRLIASGGTGIDIFTAKYNNSGNLLWAKQSGSNSAEYSRAISTDASGNVYLTGDYFDSTSFGSITLPSYGQNDLFIVKLNTNGDVVWAKHAGGERSDQAADIVSDASGNTYITGNFMMTGTFGSKQLSSDYNGSAFFVKYDNSGECVWASQSSTGSQPGATGIAIDAAGNVYATGYFWDNLVLGQFTLTSTGNSDLYIAKLNSNGEFLWAKNAGGSGTNDVLFRGFIAVDSYGNSYLSGYFEGTVIFGNDTLICAGISDPYVAKFDATGNPVWARSAGGPYIDDSNTIALIGNSQIVIGGTYGEHTIFGGVELPYWGCYTAKYATSTGIQDDEGETPDGFYLSQNFPNPFNPSTIINYQLMADAHVSLKVFDLLGNEVAELVNYFQPAGTYNYEFKISDYNLVRRGATGVYYYRLIAGDFVSTKKMILIK